MSDNVCNVEKANWKASVVFLLPSDDSSEYYTVVCYSLKYKRCVDWLLRKIKSLNDSDFIFLSSSIDPVGEADFDSVYDSEVDDD